MPKTIEEPTMLRPRRLGARLYAAARFLTTPLLPEHYVDLVDPLRSSAQLRGRIVAVLPETPVTVTIMIRPSRGWRAHIPGQYLRLGIDVDGVRQWRAYSLTSVPQRRDGTITITVTAIPHGKVSDYLVRRVSPGTLVQLAPADGDFVLPRQRPAKVLFVTAGSGITPVMGMLRSASGELTDAVLLHSAPTGKEMIFAGELRTLARHDALRLVERHTARDGRFDVSELDALVPDWAERETWACGPSDLLDSLEAHWIRYGCSERLHVERFRPAVIAAPADGGEVTFTRSDRVIDTDGATTLLDAGEAAGVLMPSGCRMGICFGCVVPLRSGAVRDLRNGEVTTASPGDGVLVQTCVSAAAGTCAIDI